MHYVLVDGLGSSLESWDDKQSALRAYAGLVYDDPKAAGELAVLACDDDGVAIARIDDAEARPAARRSVQ